MMSKILRAKILISEKGLPMYAKDRIEQIHANMILRKIKESPFKDEKEEVIACLKQLN